MALTRPRIQLPERYRVTRHVATGGMAAVYAATDEVLGREVAIKVLAEALAVEEDARQRFTREARAAAKVSDHPHVVTIYDIAETDEDPPLAFMVMELLTGGTVNDRIKSGEPIPHALALQWLEQAASALDAAHAAEMVHRDVKPANLLLDGQGTLKVADFGIARILSDAPLTQAGQVVGTAAYFSPEQALGKPATPASDRYSLAAVAYELLTGRRPFREATPAAQALAHVEQEPPAPSSVAANLPREVDRVLARGLAKDPGERPATASDLVEELRGALGPTATTAVAPEAIRRFDRDRPPAGVAIPDPERPPTPRPRVDDALLRRAKTPSPDARVRPRAPRPAAAAAAGRSSRRSRLGLVAIAAAALLLAGIAVAALSGGGGGGSQDRAASSTPAKRPAAVKRPHDAARRQPAKAAVPAGTTASPAPITASSTGGGVPAGASATQAQAHSLIGQGRYSEAAAMLVPMVRGCDVAVTDPCAYAWFDLGRALRLGGDPQQAIPVLEHRLQNPDQQGTVQAELDAARQAAGAAAPADRPGPPGKAKGRGKKHGG